MRARTFLAIAFFLASTAVRADDEDFKRGDAPAAQPMGVSPDPSASVTNGFHPFGQGTHVAVGRPFSEFGQNTGSDTAAQVHTMVSPVNSGAAAPPPQAGAPPVAKPNADPKSAPPPGGVTKAATAADPSPVFAGASTSPPPAKKEETEADKEEEAEADNAEAAENFESVLQAYLAKNATDGIWRYDSPNGKSRDLVYLNVDTKRLMTTGGRRFLACAAFQDAVKKKIVVHLEAAVDLTDPDWHVLSIKAPSKQGPCSPR